MFPLRMLEWFFTTPVIITLISCHLKKSRTNYKLKRYALAANWMMIVAGFLEQLYPGMWGAIWLTISCVRASPPPTDNCPQPKEAQPLSHALKSDY